MPFTPVEVLVVFGGVGGASIAEATLPVFLYFCF